MSFSHDWPEPQMVHLSDCLAFEGKAECQLLFGPIIGIIVSIATLVKAAAILFGRLGCINHHRTLLSP